MRCLQSEKPVAAMCAMDAGPTFTCMRTSPIRSRSDTFMGFASSLPPVQGAKVTVLGAELPRSGTYYVAWQLRSSAARGAATRCGPLWMPVIHFGGVQKSAGLRLHAALRPQPATPPVRGAGRTAAVPDAHAPEWNHPFSASLLFDDSQASASAF